MGNYIEVCCNSDYFMNEGGIEIGKDTTLPPSLRSCPLITKLCYRYHAETSAYEEESSKCWNQFQ